MTARGFVFCHLALVIATGCASSGPQVRTPGGEARYTIVVDAGSSGSRAYVYRVAPDRHDELPEVVLVDSKSVTPGISELDFDEAEGHQNLQALLDFAEETVPEAERRTTRFYIMATAGMRLLTETRRNSILEEVNDFFAKGHTFDFRGATVIAGSYEGLYSWLALNYADDRFDPTTEREGILEMGGASTQIAFAERGPFAEHHLQRAMRGREYHVYSRSFLFLGMVEAISMTITPSCYPRGYQMDFGLGTGDFDSCVSYIKDRFGSMCENIEANRGPHCVYERPVESRRGITYFAIPAFKEIFEFLELGQEVSLEELATKGRAHCAIEWGDLVEKYPDLPPIPLKIMCFNAAYYWSLIADGYGLDDDASMIVPRDGSWTLGAVVDTELGHSPMAYELRR